MDRVPSAPVSTETAIATPVESSGDEKLAILLAMAMFVLVVDTSLMNVSISAVVHDLDTTASGVQSAIALEALVSAAFILIGSKIGDLIGRKRAYVLGLLGYAVGALSMTLSQSLLPIVIFWAVIGGLGASLLLPVDAVADPRELPGRHAATGLRAGRRRGRDRGCDRAAGRRLHHDVPLLADRVPRRGRDHRDRAPGQQARPRCPVHRRRAASTSSARSSPRSGMGGVVLGILVWEEGGEAVGVLMPSASSASGRSPGGCVRRKREGKPALIDAGLFTSKYFRLGITSQTLQQIALGGLMIALPIYLQMVLEYNAMEAGLSLAPLSLSMFGVALVAGKKAGKRSPSRIIQVGFLLLAVGIAVLIPVVPRADSGWAMVAPLLIAGAGLGLLVSQLNNYTLSPIEEERVSEAAGVNSAGGSFGLVVRARLRRRDHACVALPDLHAPVERSAVLSPTEQQQVAKGLEKNAEVMTNTHLEELLAGQPADVKAEILDINTKARPSALQIALLVPLIAALLGLVNGFRMTRLPDPEPSAGGDEMLLA